MAAKGIELASAYISLSVSTDKVPRQLRDALRGIKDVEIDVDAKTGGATTEMSRWRTGEERKNVNIKVDVDTKGASSKVGGVRRDVGMLRRDMEGLGRSDLLKLNLGLAGISALPALASGLAEVAAAMQQVAQAGLAVPGGIAGAVASIGTLAFGLTGVSDAYDAVTKASDDAASSTGSQASQARAAMSASNGLRNAVVDETQARKDVARATRDARNELVDLNVEMRGGVISEKRAVLEAQKAREDLMSGNFTDVRDQLLRVEEADQRVIETRSRNAQTTEQLTDANAKGVAGSDQVVAANERLVRSQQNVSEAQASVAASGPKASAAQEKAALAMSKLSPNAREFVDAMVNLQGPIMDLRNLVQDNIFTGMADQLTGLTRKLMPNLEKGLGAISQSWNKNFNELFDVLGSGDSVSLLDRILGNTAEAQDRLTGVIDPLIEGVGTLTAAGTDVLPRLADAFVGVSDRFADFITSADQDGRLEKWINEGIDALGHLGEIALNVGKMITGITGVTDGGFLQWLNDVTGKWQEWINSTEGQSAIKDFFAEGRDIFEQWKPLIEDIPGLFQGIYEGAQMYISPLLEILKPITEFLSDHPKLVGAAIAAWAGWGAAALAIGGVTKAVNALTLALGGSALGAGGKAMNAGKGVGLMSAFGAVPGLGKLLVAAGVAGPLLGELLNAGPDQRLADAKNQQWIDSQNAPGVAPVFGPTQGSTQGPVGPSFGPQLPVSPPTGQGSYTPGQNPLGNISANPNNADTHGVLMPTTQGLMDRYHGMGFSNIGGYGPPDGFNEHSSGKAIDLMTGADEAGVRKGNAVLPDVLSQPGVQYVIWQNKMWYPDGRVEPYSGYGATTDPTKMHMDHLHIKTFGTGGDVSGAGSATSDSIPAYLSNGEHVLTANDVQALGGQGGVYAFRNALHRRTGGAVPMANPNYDWGSDTFGRGDPAANRWWWTDQEKDKFIAPIMGPHPGWSYSPNAKGGGHSGIGRGVGTIWEWIKSHPAIDPGMLPPTNPNFQGAGFRFAEGGAITLEELLKQGVDPNTLQHGTGAGAMPGPQQGAVDPAVEQQFGFGSQPGDQGGVRTEGYIPAGAGFSGKTGGGLAGGFIQMGAEAINGLIDQAASMGGGAANLFAPGSGAAVQMGAGIAKRGVQWGADMLGIGIGAITEILSPFGAPRWLSDVDPTAFMPQWNSQPTATTTAEKTQLATQAPTPVDPMSTQHGTGQGQPPGPGMPGAPVQPGQFPGSGAPGITAAPPAAAGAPPGQPPAPMSPSINPQDPMSWLSMFGIFDQGGVLPPKGAGINLSNRPEYVFTQSQFKNMEANASGGSTRGRNGPLVHIDSVTGMNPDDVAREIGTRTRRASRQYSVRP